MQHRTNLYILKLSFFSFCLIATLVSITQVSAEGGANNTVSTSSSATASVTVSSACSFERTGTGTGEYTGTLTNNGSVEVPGSTFKTICNDPGGYAIYAIGYSNDTLGNTDLIFNNTPESTNNIKTDGTNGNSYWKMKAEGISSPGTPPSIVNDFNNYHTIPTTYTKIAELNTTTDTANTTSENITGSSISISYQAYASSTQPAGTYTGAVKYTMVHPNVTTGNPYIIIFDSNGGTGDMNAQAILPNTSTPLSANTYAAPTGKAFGGWCTTSTTGCLNGTIYTNEQNVTNLTTEGGEVTLYAMWYYTMQDITSTQLAELMPNLNDSTRLVDKRDGKTYWVAKLGDTNSSNYWMTQNLDFDLVGGNTLTHYDTDLGWTSLDTEATWTIGNNYSTIPWDAANNTFTGWENQANIPYSADPGEKYYYSSGTTNPDVTFNSIAQCIEANHTQADCEHYSVGNYYNWTASVANSITNSGNALNSICPANWRLPKTSENEFASLIATYNVISDISSNSYTTDNDNVKIGFNIIRSNPLYFVRSGVVSNGRTGSVTSYGYYWSSAYSDATNTKGLFFSNASISPAYYNRKGDGRSLRCLAR